MPDTKPTQPNATLYMPMSLTTVSRIARSMPKGSVVRADPKDSSVLHVYFVEGEVYDDGDDA